MRHAVGGLALLSHLGGTLLSEPLIFVKALTAMPSVLTEQTRANLLQGILKFGRGEPLLQAVLKDLHVTDGTKDLLASFDRHLDFELAKQNRRVRVLLGPSLRRLPRKWGVGGFASEEQRICLQTPVVMPVDPDARFVSIGPDRTLSLRVRDEIAVDPVPILDRSRLGKPDGPSASSVDLLDRILDQSIVVALPERPTPVGSACHYLLHAFCVLCSQAGVKIRLAEVEPMDSSQLVPLPASVVSAAAYKHELSVCVILKDEAPFLAEWIEFNVLNGVGHFFIFDNDSKDDFDELIAPYVRDGLATVIRWPGDHPEALCLDTYAIQSA